jgi:hypothetical protein
MAQFVRRKTNNKDIKRGMLQENSNHGADQKGLRVASSAASGSGKSNMKSSNLLPRYNKLYQQKLLHLRREMSRRYSQYGSPAMYPPDLAQQYGTGMERTAKAWLQDLMRRERELKAIDLYDSDDAMNRSPPPVAVCPYEPDEPRPPFVFPSEDVTEKGDKGTLRRSRNPQRPEIQTHARSGDSVLINFATSGRPDTPEFEVWILDPLNHQSRSRPHP